MRRPMLTDEQLDRIERHAHPRTNDGKLIQRLCRAVRTGAENYARVSRERDLANEAAAQLVLAIGDLGYRIEMGDGEVTLVPADGGDA